MGSAPDRADPVVLECARLLAAEPGGEQALPLTFALVGMAPYIVRRQEWDTDAESPRRQPTPWSCRAASRGRSSGSSETRPPLSPSAQQAPSARTRTGMGPAASAAPTEPLT